MLLPIEVNGERADMPSPAPHLGAHSSKILQEIAYSSSQIDAFVISGVVSIFSKSN